MHPHAGKKHQAEWKPLLKRWLSHKMDYYHTNARLCLRGAEHKLQVWSDQTLSFVSSVVRLMSQQRLQFHLLACTPFSVQHFGNGCSNSAEKATINSCTAPYAHHKTLSVLCMPVSSASEHMAGWASSLKDAMKRATFRCHLNSIMITCSLSLTSISLDKL